jgi:hypothetical protein
MSKGDTISCKICGVSFTQKNRTGPVPFLCGSKECRQAQHRINCRRYDKIKLVKKECAVCKTTFELFGSKTNFQKTCSNVECQKAWPAQKRREERLAKYGPKVMLSFGCINCGKEFKKIGFKNKKYDRKQDKKHCSRKCACAYASKEARLDGRAQLIAKKSREKHRTKILEKRRKLQSKLRKELSDEYVKVRIWREYKKFNLKISTKDIPQYLVNMKREELKLDRSIKNLSRTNRPKGCNLAFEE